MTPGPRTRCQQPRGPPGAGLGGKGAARGAGLTSGHGGGSRPWSWFPRGSAPGSPPSRSPGCRGPVVGRCPCPRRGCGRRRFSLRHGRILKALAPRPRAGRWHLSVCLSVCLSHSHAHAPSGDAATAQGRRWTDSRSRGLGPGREQNRRRSCGPADTADTRQRRDTGDAKATAGPARAAPHKRGVAARPGKRRRRCGPQVRAPRRGLRCGPHAGAP